MRLVKFFWGLLGLVVCISLTGCGARFINAKVAKVPASMSLTGNPTGLLHNPDNLPPAAKQEAEHLRDISKDFYADKEKDLDISGNLNGAFMVQMLAVSQNYIGDSPDPTEFNISTTTAHRKGETTQHGEAEIRFGSTGPVYTTQSNGGFFELTVSDIFKENGDWIASGTFSLIAKNKDNPSDETRLFIMDGSFVTRIRNH